MQASREEKMNQKRFSNAALTYNLHALPQIKLAKSLVDFLPNIQPKHILEIGCGTGIFTRMINKKYPTANIDAIDIAEKMVSESQQKLNHLKKIKWTVGNAEIYQGIHPYDLIASSATLHWSSNLNIVMKNIYNNLTEKGYFILGIMLRGTLWELRELRRMIAPSKGPGLSLPPEAIVDQSIKNAGFETQKVKINKEKVMYDDTKSFLKAIHEQGVTGLSKKDSPLNRSELNELINTYQNKYNTIAGVYATYETAQYLLYKPLTKRKLK